MSAATPAPIQGVVEGFYGRPWTARQRQQLFAWLGDAGLNAYLYAPKDDLKHRALWRELYTEAEVADLRCLVERCRARGLQFIYALGPGLDIVAARPEETAALVARFDQVLGLGAAHAALLWDDIPARLCPEDEQAFGTPAAAQCAVTNRVFEALRQKRPGIRLLFCPTAYCGRMAEPSVPGCAYLQAVGERLAPEIDFLWTGPQIISETIPVESIRELRRAIRRRPIVWDNLHANDYDHRRLYLGPYAGRPAALREEINGVLLNPNCQFEANFVPIHTLGGYCRGAGGADPREAYLRAIGAWLPAFAGRGRHALRAEDLELLGDLLYLPDQLGARAQSYLDDFSRLLRTGPEGWGDVAVRFERTSLQIVAMYDRLTELEDRDLLYALYPHVWELKETALLLLAWTVWRRGAPSADARFRSPDFRPKIFRGGFTAAIERLLPMDDQGWFAPSPARGPDLHAND